MWFVWKKLSTFIYQLKQNRCSENKDYFFYYFF